MRIIPLSKCEVDFISASLASGHRLDGRQLKDYRELRLFLGKENGTALAELGNTKVFASVSADIVEPRAASPASGTLYINVELSSFVGRFLDGFNCNSVRSEISRLLERCIKESGCIDVESLCIIRGKKVWQIRINVDVFSSDGSVIDCASVAVFAALRHFKRPRVSVVGTDFVVHISEETEELCLYHTPLCFTYGFKDEDDSMVVDPTEDEAQIVDNLITIAVNVQRQICVIHSGKAALVKKNMILRCISMVMQRVKVVSNTIKEALNLANDTRNAGGFDLIVNQKPSEMRSIFSAHADFSFTKFKDIKLQPEPSAESDVGTTKKFVMKSPKDTNQKWTVEGKAPAATISNQTVNGESASKLSGQQEKVNVTKLSSEKDINLFLQEMEVDYAVLTAKDFGYNIKNK